ncbi:pantetheine-phosphate adenylyltransferase [Lentimicrobium sp.]|jgi:pantetheine-phosphate adenylyltransferase|uniref:pantetheine-phosphate adenylyltransferase n=1 Tax=Lentimicrobium sp. TaxID=2034841 RepID=UPI0025EAF6CC|nr:pantetheine-phosphate adenylyltransferase [Lentimicrobium sp.]MCO5257924.1 pantetheine-phosphate adenylyltransferase [Lentimicrobium sp.]MCO5263464.1 pantetheine-phosphate adenylyltransferase [Lentimicrobium sp.]HOP12431.1 pantetheine-phosphate adenylyltransferase [Lentimicrobium sp.]HPF63611.1 pantetheine-phosphate adenylyltransferase [Lentimicrobium sp.]HPJ62157.1 pantetheine-phosphate adenylyltransferase [Lentimicrobium sp.]
MIKRAVFPGSFDPITRGHENIIRRALPLFDEIIVAIGLNIEKKNYFDLNDRIRWIQTVFADCPQIKVDSYSGLTVDYCRDVSASFILRGLRTSADFEFERTVGQVNKKLYPDIETVFLLTTPDYTSINSSIVRDVYKNGGDVSIFIPDAVKLPVTGKNK